MIAGGFITANCGSTPDGNDILVLKAPPSTRSTRRLQGDLPRRHGAAQSR